MFRGATGTIYSPVEGVAPRGGGQAELFKVRAPRGGLFAVKRARTPSDNARLRRELEHIDELYKTSPACASWLVEVLDRGEHEGRAFFVMRWHESSLEDWMRAAAWPLGARLKQAAALCRLVERFFAVAGSRIVHHDIKPANILLDDRAAEGLLLADLAGSRGLAGAHRSSSVGVMTATYAPPELALPHGRQASVQVDRFSTAVTVYELITGARPLRAAPQLWTDEGMALWSLHQQRLAGEELDEHEEAELARLSARPLSVLMRRDGALLIGNFDRKLSETLGTGPLVPLLTSSLRSMLSALPEERLSPPAALVPLLEALAVEVGAAAGPAAPLSRGEVPSVRVGGPQLAAPEGPRQGEHVEESTTERTKAGRTRPGSHTETSTEIDAEQADGPPHRGLREGGWAAPEPNAKWPRTSGTIETRQPRSDGEEVGPPLTPMARPGMDPSGPVAPLEKSSFNPPANPSVTTVSRKPDATGQRPGSVLTVLVSFLLLTGVLVLTLYSIRPSIRQPPQSLEQAPTTNNEGSPGSNSTKPDTGAPTATSSVDKGTNSPNQDETKPQASTPTESAPEKPSETPKPPANRTRETPKAKKRSTGTVTIGADERAKVTIDGAFVRFTPLFRYELGTGPHTVTLQTDDGQSTSFDIKVTASEDLRRVWSFEQGQFE